jgi:hypothetical protein
MCTEDGVALDTVLRLGGFLTKFGMRVQILLKPVHIIFNKNRFGCFRVDNLIEVIDELFNNKGYITKRPTWVLRAFPLTDINGCKSEVGRCTGKLSVHFIHNIPFPSVSKIST